MSGQRPSSARVVLRRAELSDSAAIAVLVTQLGYPVESVEQCRQRLGQLIGLADNQLWLAEEEGAVVGWMHLVHSLRLTSGPFVEIVGLAVSESCQRRGIGHQLLGRATAWATALDCELRVRTSIVREGARRFYQDAGFEQSKTQAVFCKAAGEGGNP